MRQGTELVILENVGYGAGGWIITLYDIHHSHIRGN
jgi:hypothetical protein